MSMDKQVKLVSLDAEIFLVDELVAHESQILKDMIKAVGNESPIPLPNVSIKMLQKMIDYCLYHAELKKRSDDDPAVSREEVKKWDEEFVKVDYLTLVGLIKAADYLNIENLLDLAGKAIADVIINCKSVEEIRKTINTGNDYTQEEEEDVEARDEWAIE